MSTNSRLMYTTFEILYTYMYRLDVATDRYRQREIFLVISDRKLIKTDFIRGFKQC